MENNSVATPTEKEIVKCYGKYRVENQIDKCPRRSICPWGEACLSRANEKAEEIHYQKQNISVGFMQYDCGDGCSKSKSSCGYEDGTPEEIECRAEREAMSVTADQSFDENDIEFEEISIPANAYPYVCRAVEKIAELYFNHHSTFDCLIKKIYRGDNQSQIARDENITRQGLNKRLLFELGIAQKRNDIQARRDKELAEAKIKYEDEVERIKNKYNIVKNLTPREFSIYKLYFVDGCTEKSVAKQLKCSIHTVSTWVCKVRVILNNNNNEIPEEWEFRNK